MSNRWEHFDGLRVWAMLVIIASHTAALGMYGQGSVMVSLFYALSGFFCVMPMIADGEEKFACAGGWFKFYVLRLVRLIPVYWLIVLMFYWISDTAFADKKALFDNLFLINTYGHLWYLQHEVVCYLVAPVIVAIIHVIKKKISANNILTGVVLIVAGGIMSKYLFSTARFCLMWNGEPRQLRLGLFVIGMGVGYVVKGLGGRSFNKKITIIVGDVAAILLMLTISVFTSAAFLTRFNAEFVDYYIGWNRPILCTFICAGLIFVMAVNPKGIIAKIMSLPILVKFGKVTYGVYLIHFFLIEFVAVAPLKQFVLVTILSFSVALLLYEMIEEPLYCFVKN